MKKDFNLSNDIRIFIAEDIINTFLNKVNNSTSFIDANINHFEFFYNKLMMNVTINNRENIENFIFGDINLDLTFERNSGSLIIGANGRLAYTDSNDLSNIATINLTTIPAPSEEIYNGTGYDIIISIDGEDIKKEYTLLNGKLIQRKNNNKTLSGKQEKTGNKAFGMTFEEFCEEYDKYNSYSDDISVDPALMEFVSEPEQSQRKRYRIKGRKIGKEQQ